MSNKKQISGLICEFNPLHKGHEYILKQMKRDNLVVCVMSGNFVQRGEPAIIDKWTRAKLAVLSGADLVIELPVGVSASTAQNFSLGSVKLLNALSCVDTLCFGSEIGDIKNLLNISDIILSDSFSEHLKPFLKKGISFASAREKAVASLMGSDYSGELSGSNNILGIEYINALKTTKSKIKPVTIKRLGAKHDQSSDTGFTSAMDIRKKVIIGDNFDDLSVSLPLHTFDAFYELISSGFAPCSISKLETAILCKLRTLKESDFDKIFDISEGLENKLIKAIKCATTLEELYDKVKSKRYSHARIRRIVLHAFLEIDKSMCTPKYIKILAMSKNGSEILRRAKPKLPIIGKANDIKKLKSKALKIYELECKCDDIYALSSPKIRECGLNMSSAIYKGKY